MGNKRRGRAARQSGAAAASQEAPQGALTRVSDLTGEAGAVQTKVSATGSDPGAVDGLQDPLRGSAAADPLQASAMGDPLGADVKSTAAQGVAGSGGAMPHLDTIQASFGGHDLGDVQAHVGGSAGDAAGAIGAQAYTQGNNVAFKGGPSLHTAAHEAAHVVQQREGVSLADGVGQAGDSYERNADAVADRVVQGQSAADLLPSGGAQGDGGTVQRQSTDNAVQRDPGEEQDVDQSHGMEQSILHISEWTGVSATVLEMVAHKLEHSLSAKTLSAIKLNVARLRSFGSAVTKLARGSHAVVVGIGLHRIWGCIQNSDTLGAWQAVGDTGLHALTACNPFTAVIDGVLSLAFGTDWLSKLANGIADGFFYLTRLPYYINKYVEELRDYVGAVTKATRNAMNNLFTGLFQAAKDGFNHATTPENYDVHQMYVVTAALKGGDSSDVVRNAIRALVTAYGLAVKDAKASSTPDQLLGKMAGPMSMVMANNMMVAKPSAETLSKAAQVIVQSHKTKPRDTLASADTLLAQPFHKAMASLEQLQVIKVAKA
jgi:hypothetical protein